MTCLIQVDMKSFLPFVMSLLIVNIIVGSSYAWYRGSNDYFYKTTGYSGETEKATDEYKASIVEGFGLDSNITTPSDTTYSDESLRLVNQSEVIKFELPSFKSNTTNSCYTYFKCKPDFTTGWKDKTSIQVSTNNTKDETSKIIAQEADVKPEARYQLVMHIKLNQWATQSRIILEGFNESSGRWYHIDQCPSANVNGPLDWEEFSCGVTIEANTTKVRPVLMAGWSSQPKMEATTWFDSIYLRQFRSFLADPNLVTQVISQGLDKPISMAFLGPNDFLVSSNDSTVYRIVNGVELSKQSLDLDVAGDGILGIAVNKNIEMNQTGTTKGSTYVFVHFTANKEENEDSNSTKGTMINRLYRYEFVNNTLINPKLLLEFNCDFNHNGGPILIGPDKHTVYFAGGDCENEKFEVIANKALNNKTGSDPDGTGGILQITEDGNPVGETGNLVPHILLICITHMVYGRVLVWILIL